MSDTNPVGDFSVTDPGAPASMGTVEALFKHMRDWVRAEMAKAVPAEEAPTPDPEPSVEPEHTDG